MTNGDWAASESASEMLLALYEQSPDYFASQKINLKRFLIACCWKHKHLIPQQEIRQGLRLAEGWINGDVGDEEIFAYDWYMEAEAFRFDFAKTKEDFDDIRETIAGIVELEGVPFNDAMRLLQEAAHFADDAMIYPMFRGKPWIKSIFTSQFLCPELLRQYISPDFNTLD